MSSMDPCNCRGATPAPPLQQRQRAAAAPGPLGKWLGWSNGSRGPRMETSILRCSKPSSAFPLFSTLPDKRAFQCSPAPRGAGTSDGTAPRTEMRVNPPGSLTPPAERGRSPPRAEMLSIPPRCGPRTVEYPWAALCPPTGLRGAPASPGRADPRMLAPPALRAHLRTTSPGRRPPTPQPLGTAAPTWSGCDGGGGFPLPPGCAGCSFMAVIAGYSAPLAWAALTASHCRCGPGQLSLGASHMTPTSPGSGAATEEEEEKYKRGRRAGGAEQPLPRAEIPAPCWPHSRAPTLLLGDGPPAPASAPRRAPSALPPASLHPPGAGCLVPPPSSQQVSQRCLPAWERPFGTDGAGAMPEPPPALPRGDRLREGSPEVLVAGLPYETDDTVRWKCSPVPSWPALLSRDCKLEWKRLICFNIIAWNSQERAALAGW